MTASLRANRPRFGRFSFTSASLTVYEAMQAQMANTPRWFLLKLDGTESSPGVRPQIKVSRR